MADFITVLKMLSALFVFSTVAGIGLELGRKMVRGKATNPPVNVHITEQTLTRMRQEAAHD